ncbi:MAG TPA: hypothetical protein VJ933_07030 [Phaeodactylibacter sp.]|nr:hypothetical protein [Phaeodactylibacter sp.]
MKNLRFWLIAFCSLLSPALLYGQSGQLPVRVVEAYPSMLYAGKLNLPVVPDEKPLEEFPGMRYFNPADHLTQIKTYRNGKPKPIFGFASARFFMEELGEPTGPYPTGYSSLTTDFLKRYAQPFYFKKWEVTNLGRRARGLCG